MKKRKWPVVRLSLFAVVLMAMVLTGLGCVQGLQPVGWSGGLIDEGTLYVGSKQGMLVSVNMADEGRKWSDELRAESSGGFGCPGLLPGGGCQGEASGVAIYGTPVVSGDLVYIAGYNGKIYAFNKDSLYVRWVFPREDYIEPVISGVVIEGDTLYFGGGDGKVYALDAATGDPVNEFQTGDKIWSTPVVAGDILLVASFDGKLYALDKNDISRKKWEVATEGAIVSTPLVHEGTVYIGSFDRNLYAVDVETGQIKWKFMGENWFWATPVVVGNSIYAPCLDEKVYVLQADSGVKQAEVGIDSSVASTPVIFENSVILASRDGVLYTIDAGSNTIRQLANIEADIYGPISLADGVVYAHTPDLTLHRVNALTGAELRPISLEKQD